MTYNSAEVIDSCLEALRKMAPEVAPIVVDNASSDNTAARVQARSGVRLIANGENRGFAAAVNQGVREAGEGQFILLLNPDVQLLTSIENLVTAAAEGGLAAGRLVDKAGRSQAGFTIRRFPTPTSLVFELFGLNRLWPANPVNRAYRYLDRDLEKPGIVEQPAGAFLLFRRDVWHKLGGFDESFYPVWFEDVDFCRRGAEAGDRVSYVPSVAARHQGGHSVNRIPAGIRATYWCASLLTYAAKHFHPLAFRVICIAMVLSSIPRMFVGVLDVPALSSVRAYLRIMRFAGLCLVSLRHIKNLH